MYKGWGEKKVLIKDDVIAKAKTKEEKEALHQKNRRTVFRIVNWDYVDPNAPKTEKPVYKPQVKGEENSEITRLEAARIRARAFKNTYLNDNETEQAPQNNKFVFEFTNY